MSSFEHYWNRYKKLWVFRTITVYSIHTRKKVLSRLTIMLFTLVSLSALDAFTAMTSFGKLPHGKAYVNPLLTDEGDDDRKDVTIIRRWYFLMTHSPGVKKQISFFIIRSVTGLGRTRM